MTGAIELFWERQLSYVDEFGHHTSMFTVKPMAGRGATSIDLFEAICLCLVFNGHLVEDHARLADG